MSEAVLPEAMAADQDGEVVLFLIGMRINSWRAVRQWFPVFIAMPSMIREVLADPSVGCLSVRTFWSGRTIMTVQYWASTEKLLAYSHDARARHLPAWRRFNRRAGRGTAVGIFHETYPMAAGSTESVYRSMPPFGLAAVVGARPQSGNAKR